MLKKWKNVSLNDWADWKWQIRNSVDSVQEINKIFSEFCDFRVENDILISQAINSFEFKITPYSILNIKNSIEKYGLKRTLPLILTFIPSSSEITSTLSETTDSIGEDALQVHPTKLITQLYPDRVLFCLNFMCASYCRYCLRRRKIGDGEMILQWDEINKSLDYIQSNVNIRDVVLSGGEPLIYNCEILDKILSKISSIKHIKCLRIDTKMPVVIPQRINSSLISVLKKYKPLYMVIHFTHPFEITEEVSSACNELVDNGIPLFSHTPLLKNINDDENVIKNLFLSLIEIRVKPYYLIHHIPNKWNEHFRVPIEKGLEIMKSLQGNISELALPTYIVYLPKSAGKIPLSPNYIVEKTDDGYWFKNYEGRHVFYSEQKEEHTELVQIESIKQF